jgi:hypothetical protein
MVRLAAFIAGFVVMAWSVAVAAAPDAVDGWAIARADSPTACVATGRPEGEANLSLVADGPLFEMIAVATDFPQEKSTYPLTLAFDDSPPVQAVALGEKGRLAISVGRGEPARTIAAASRVRVTVQGRAHDFSLANAGAALDAVARCAGQPALAGQDEPPAGPIAGAGGWQLMVTMPGVPERACAARIAGDQIDIVMLLNSDGDLVLVGGHNDWASWGDDVALQLSIDGAPPLAMPAKTVKTLIMTLIADPDQLRRLRSAKTLDWTLPTGHARGKITGLGVALEAMKACKAREGS